MHALPAEFHEGVAGCLILFAYFAKRVGSSVKGYFRSQREIPRGDNRRILHFKKTTGGTRRTARISESARIGLGVERIDCPPSVVALHPEPSPGPFASP